jgi:hypothetical protein
MSSSSPQTLAMEIVGILRVLAERLRSRVVLSSTLLELPFDVVAGGWNSNLNSIAFDFSLIEIECIHSGIIISIQIEVRIIGNILESESHMHQILQMLLIHVPSDVSGISLKPYRCF